MRTTDPRHHPKKWKTQSQQARKLTGHRCCLCWRKATETHHAFYGMRLLGATLHIPGRELPGWQLFPLCDRHHSNRPGAVHHFHHYRVNKSDHWGNHNTTAYLWRLRIGFLLAVAIAHLHLTLILLAILWLSAQIFFASASSGPFSSPPSPQWPSVTQRAIHKPRN